MSIGECGDASTLPRTAAELFQIAALLMGSGAAAVSLVEQTLASVEIDPCQDPETARRLARHQVLLQGAERLRALAPESFRVPAGLMGAGSGCVQDDDLDAAGLSHAQLGEWLAGGGRQDLRDWLAALPPAERVIFVERAVLGESGASTAAVLEGAGHSSAPAASQWTPEAVGTVYRQVLCSLANALAHAPAAREPSATGGSAHV